MPVPLLPYRVAPGSRDRLVLLHNWPQGPASFDGKATGSDYYTTGYQSPAGEGGKHAAYGGLVRDQPLESENLAAWKVSRAAGELADQRTDIEHMVAVGADGTALDLLSIAATSDNTRRQRAHLQAAAEHPSFTVMLQPDMNASGVVGATAAVLAAYVVGLARLGGRATMRHADGRVVVSPFKAEAWTPAKWAQFAEECARLGEPVVFRFVLVNWPGKWAAYAAVPGCVGLSPWGERTIAGADRMVQAGREVRALGMAYMAPVAVQDVRPSQRKAWESHGFGALLALTQAAIEADADVLLVCTANDTTESTNVLPSVNAGWARMAMVGWCGGWFRDRTPPVVVRGAIIVSQRPHAAAAVPTGQTDLAVWQGPSPVDVREVLTFTPGHGMTRQMVAPTYPAGRPTRQDLTYHSTMTVVDDPVPALRARVAELEADLATAVDDRDQARAALTASAATVSTLRDRIDRARTTLEETP